MVNSGQLCISGPLSWTRNILLKLHCVVEDKPGLSQSGVSIHQYSPTKDNPSAQIRDTVLYIFKSQIQPNCATVYSSHRLAYCWYSRVDFLVSFIFWSIFWTKLSKGVAFPRDISRPTLDYGLWFLQTKHFQVERYWTGWNVFFCGFVFHMGSFSTCTTLWKVKWHNKP